MGYDPHRRTHFRIFHHRAGGDDDLRALTWTALLQIQTVVATRVCDGRALVFEYLCRRSADALRGSSGRDGGVPMGMGLSFYVYYFWMEGIWGGLFLYDRVSLSFSS